MTPKLRSRFLLLRQLAGMPDVTLRIGRAVEFPRKRDYAYCHLRDDGRIAIVVAPKIRRASIARIDGLLTHEFGHAAHFAAGRIEHSERAADAAAERLFGVRISYDRDDVQTTDLGLRPRPARLDRPGRRKNGDRDKLVRHLRSHCGMTAEDADKVAPTKSVKSSRRALSPEQQTVFVSTVHRVVADPGPRTILLLLLATGMRIAECCNLPLAAFVTTPRGRLKADVLGKGSKLRTVSMTRRGSSLIREYVKRYRVGGSGHLFTGPRGGKVTPRQVQLACKSVADAMGVRGLTPHVLRHSYASTQVLNCRDLQSLRMQLGHGKLDTPRKKLRRLPLVTLTYLDF